MNTKSIDTEQIRQGQLFSSDDAPQDSKLEPSCRQDGRNKPSAESLELLVQFYRQRRPKAQEQQKVNGSTKAEHRSFSLDCINEENGESAD